ncbi:MAG: sulfurtransferase [Lentimicrobiaceae bacterium]|jgi:thiosulfate/3-mercaptopyruvate sulfurtransferase
MKRILFVLISLFGVLSLQAKVSISAKDFGAELKSNKAMVVIDVQAPDVYAKQHIQGAINIPHKSLYKTGPKEGQFLELAELAAIFGKKGVSNTSKIVLYDDGSQKYNSRVWWVLKYLGATDVYLLHKDMTEMESARIPMTNTSLTLKATTFTPAINADMNIDMATLKSLLDNPTLILLDAREKDEYEGMDKDKRSKGHLPGAIFMNYKEVLTPTGAYKSKDEILALVPQFGISPEKEIIVYCQTGIKASVIYFALKEIAGFPNVKLYAGAYAEWASVAENPIIK